MASNGGLQQQNHHKFMAYAVYMVPCQSFMAFMSAADMEIDTFMHGKKRKFQYWYFIGILMRILKVFSAFLFF